MTQESRPVVVVTEGSDPRPLEWLKERARVVEIAASDAAFFDRLAEAQGLLVRTYTKVNAALLDRAPKLKVVGRGGVGLENIDVAECRRRGCRWFIRRMPIRWLWGILCLGICCSCCGRGNFSGIRFIQPKSSSGFGTRFGGDN
jgi:hypothetical protein